MDYISDVTGLGEIVATSATNNGVAAKMELLDEYIQRDLQIDQQIGDEKRRLVSEEERLLATQRKQLARTQKKLKRKNLPGREEHEKQAKNLEEEIGKLQNVIKTKVAVGSPRIEKLKGQAAGIDKKLSRISVDVGSVQPRLGGVVQETIAATNKLSENQETVTEQSLLFGGGAFLKGQHGYQMITEQLRHPSIPFLSQAA